MKKYLVMGLLLALSVIIGGCTDKPKPIEAPKTTSNFLKDTIRNKKIADKIYNHLKSDNSNLITEKKEFEEIFDDINNNAILYYIDTLKNNDLIDISKLDDDYKKIEAKYQEFKSANFDSIFEEYQKTIAFDNSLDTTYSIHKGADAISKTISKNACIIGGIIVGNITFKVPAVGTAVGVLLAYPCTDILNVVLNPITHMVYDLGLIDDIEDAKLLIERHVRTNIIELATVCDTITVVYDHSGDGSEKGFFGGLWHWIAENDIKLRSRVVYKIGFDLQKEFKLTFNKKDTFAIVSLPQPKILSVAVYTKYLEYDEAMFNSISSETLNQIDHVIRQKANSILMKSDPFKKAKENAADVFKALLNPFVNNIYVQYPIKIKYEGAHVGF